MQDSRVPTSRPDHPCLRALTAAPDVHSTAASRESDGSQGAARRRRPDVSACPLALLGSRLLLPLCRAGPWLVAGVDFAGVDEHYVAGQSCQAHAGSIGQLAHLGGQGTADGDGEHVAVRTRARTARYVALCGAFGPGMGLCLACLGFAALSPRLRGLLHCSPSAS